MFFIQNVENWLGEVITSCNENKLDPEESIFCLVFFSSLDFECVEFFKTRKTQISSYSGDNVHIFTPIVYADDVVPDAEWRNLREDFQNSGIKIGSNPSVIFFSLCARGRTLKPNFFSAHNLPSAQSLTELLRGIVDACIFHRHNLDRLTRELTIVTKSPNVAKAPLRSELVNSIQSSLDEPRIFLSHSSRDKESVRKVCNALESHYINPWLDEAELTLGDNISNAIEQALRNSDILLLFLSENSECSNWVKHETSFFLGAIEEGRIIPVVLDDRGLELSRKLPSTQGLLYLDMRNPDDWEKGIERLLDAAEKHHQRA